jgi:hypothetical protein
MTEVNVQKLASGYYVVSEYGSWVTGVFLTESAALKACSLDPDELVRRWKSALAEGRTALTDIDVNSVADDK